MRIKHAIIVAKIHPKELWHYPRLPHREVLKKVCAHLQERRITYQVIDRKNLRLKTGKKLKADILITVGGDGTVLTTSHYAGDIPILGLNSSPKTSTGFFCLATPPTFKKILDNILLGRRRVQKIPRLKVWIGSKRVPFLVLNEALYANLLPGDTARYLLCVKHRKELQKSSGVWVATGAGSTAAIYSAGGKRIPMTSPKIQFRVREPFSYPKKTCKLTHGFLTTRQKLKITAQSGNAMIFLDGHALKIPVPQETIVSFQGGATPIKIFL